MTFFASAGEDAAMSRESVVDGGAGLVFGAGRVAPRQGHQGDGQGMGHRRDVAHAAPISG